MTTAIQSEITVHVLLFSVLKEKLGRDTMDVVLERSATGHDLLDKLAGEHPAIRDHRSVIRLAVNASYVKEDVLLSSGDEVALITPVSGG